MASDSVTSLQSNGSHCQLTVQQRLERLAGQIGGRGQDDLNGLQGGPCAQGGTAPGSVGLATRSRESVVVRM